MKIDGRLLARDELIRIRARVKELKTSKTIIPHLAVVFIGRDPASASYIRQKQKAGESTGIRVTLHHFSKTPTYQKIAEFLLSLDKDPGIHGIIIQRPLPPSLSAQILIKRVRPEKDVDAFLSKSPYIPPVGRAVFKILKEIYFRRLTERIVPEDDFTSDLIKWLKNKNIVLVGRGETGGKPIAETLTKYRIGCLILTSKSEQKEEYIKQADIIVSAVGKPGIIASQIKTGVIVIGVGIHSQQDRLFGDYDEKEIKKIAGFYTPTPGGIGPVTVACLMHNVVQAADIQSQNRRWK